MGRQTQKPSELLHSLPLGLYEEAHCFSLFAVKLFQ